MNRKKVTFILLFLLCAAASALTEPFMIETKVQNDLETALGRLMTPEQFLVMVSGEITTRSEKKLVEGEMVLGEQEEEYDPPPPMPGFVPEPTDLTAKKKKPIQTRETFRIVETPVLTALRVRVNFDDKIDNLSLTRGKDLIMSYLRANYPDRSSAVFGLMPMLKKKEEPKDQIALPPVDPKKDKDEEEAKKNDPMSWAILGGIGLIALLLLQRMFSSNEKSSGGGQPQSYSPAMNMSEMLAQAGMGRGDSRGMSSSGGVPMVSGNRRKKVLEKFLSRSEAFKLFYDRATNEERGELYTALRGPAYDSLLDGLGYRKPLEADLDPQTLEEKLIVHEKNFEEFVQAKDWQERQFFGFAHQLTDDQLLAMVNYQDPEMVGTVLRFMKTRQSAMILDALPQIRRREVLAYAQAASTKPIAELVRIEKSMREVAARIPNGGNISSPNEEADFWGNVLAESHHQDELYDDIEKTSPGIAPGLKKFKFRLEDAASLPDKILSQVLGRIDNEELCLALSTCAADVAEVILDALPEARRNILKKQMVSYKGAAIELMNEARQSVTKKFREVLA